MSFAAMQIPDSSQIRWFFNGREACERGEAVKRLIESTIVPPDNERQITVEVNSTDDMRKAVADWDAATVIRRTRAFSARLVSDRRLEMLFCDKLPERVIRRREQLERMILFGILPLILSGNALVMHGALLAKGNHGVVVSAASGTGKSTCARRIPEPWTALGDDMVLVSCFDGQYYAQALPTWSQLYYDKEFVKIHWGRFVKLSAILELWQASDDALVEISAKQQQRLLIDGFYEFWIHWGMVPNDVFYKDLAANSIDFCFEAARKITIKRLECSLHGRFWQELEKVI